jgi:hypothetical protein
MLVSGSFGKHGTASTWLAVTHACFYHLLPTWCEHGIDGLQGTRQCCCPCGVNRHGFPRGRTRTLAADLTNGTLPLGFMVGVFTPRGVFSPGVVRESNPQQPDS